MFTSTLLGLWKYLFRRSGAAWGRIPGVDEEACAAAAQERKAFLQIMTYNLFLRSPCTPDTTLFSEEYKDERLDDFLAALATAESSYDVLCFQEVFTFGHFRLERLLARLRELGFLYFARPDTHRPWYNLKQWVDSGLLTVSKLPPLAVQDEIFDDLQGGCQFTAKGFLYTALQFLDPTGAPRKLHLINAHTQSSKTVPVPEEVVPEPFPEALYRQRNLKQIRQCFTRQEEGDPRGTSVFILAGDMNIDSRRRTRTGESEVVHLYETMRGICGSPCMDPLRDGLEPKRHPSTYGDVKVDAVTGMKTPVDTVLTELDEQCCQVGFDDGIDGLVARLRP